MKTKVNKEHQELLNNLEVVTSPEGAQQMFNVKKNASGELLVAMIRKALTRSSYKLRVRGSLSDRVSLRKQGTYISDQSVPLEHADRYRVYIDESEDSFYAQKYQMYYRYYQKTLAEVTRTEHNLISANKEIERLNALIGDHEMVIGGLQFNNQQEKKQVLSLRAKLGEIDVQEEHTVNTGNVTITIKIQK